MGERYAASEHEARRDTPPRSLGYWTAGPCGACNGADDECMERMRQCVRRHNIGSFVLMVAVPGAVALVVALAFLFGWMGE